MEEIRKPIGVLDTASPRRRSRETGSPDSRNPESIGPFIAEGYVAAVEVWGSPRKEDFINSDTWHEKGKSLGLLTHEILKGSEPSDQGRL